LKKGESLGDLNVEGRIIWETEYEDMDWICLSHDGGQWQAFEATVINVLVPYKTHVFSGEKLGNS
jgi:hypothetical protein